jgi:Ca2+-binding RTX toxin-like protein
MFAKEFVADQPATSTIDPSNFSTTIDNPFLPMKPGTTFVYEDKTAHTIDYVVVTDTTRIVDGVTCVQVHDFELLNGQLDEDTLDWMAQDSEGNVWYFGELSQQYEPNNPNPVGFEGSWEAGVDGARPGIIMLADPRNGVTYSEEHAHGVAEDKATVAGLHKLVDVTYGAFGDLLETKNFTPLEPDVTEHKWYAAGIGNVLTTDNEGAYEQLVLIKVDGGDGGDTLNGYAGKDQISGAGGNDTMFGLDGHDLMSGGNGNDFAYGGNGKDVLNGDAGNDTLDGGAGRDTLVGGLGNDMLTGGSNADHFVFGEANGSAVDTITDYSQGDGDAIVLDGGKDDVAYDSFMNGAWQLTLNDGHVIVLSGLTDSNHNGHILDNLTILDAFGT